MTAARLVLSLLVSVAILLMVALTYSLAAWRAGRRFGTSGLLVALVIAILLAGALGALRVTWYALSGGTRPAAGAVRLGVFYGLALGFFGFAFSTVSLRRSLASTKANLAPRDALRRSLWSFFAGLGALLLLSLAADVARFIAH